MIMLPRIRAAQLSGRMCNLIIHMRNFHRRGGSLEFFFLCLEFVVVAVGFGVKNGFSVILIEYVLFFFNIEMIVYFERSCALNCIIVYEGFS